MCGKKEVRSFIKSLKKQCLELEFEYGKNHIKIKIIMKNRVGKIIKLPKVIISGTPSIQGWKRLKSADINRLLKENDIPEIQIIK